MNCPYCDHEMNRTGRTLESGIEYGCSNCKGVWCCVPTENCGKIDGKKGSIEKGTNTFLPVMPPIILADIMEQQPNKTQAKRTKKWAKSKRLKRQQ